MSILQGLGLFLTLVVGPCMGIWMVVRDVGASLAEGKELDEIHSRLLAHYQQYMVLGSDLSRGYAELCDFFETTIKHVNTGWLQGWLRMAIEVASVGFGEMSRRRLLRDPQYRNTVYEQWGSLLETLKEGRRTAILLDSATLLDTFLRYSEPQLDCPSDKGPTTRQQLIATLESIRPMLQKGGSESVQAALIVEESSKVMGALCNQGDVGFAALVLRWVHIQILELRETDSDQTRALATTVHRLITALEHDNVYEVSRIVLSPVWE